MCNSAWSSVSCRGLWCFELLCVLRPSGGELAQQCALMVLSALPLRMLRKQGSPGFQTGSSQLAFIFCILLSLGAASAVAVAARMGSRPWQGVQAFFHGAIELAGKVPSAAWLEPGSGCSGCSNSLVDFWQKSVSAACSTSCPPGPGCVLNRKVQNFSSKS